MVVKIKNSQEINPEVKIMMHVPSSKHIEVTSMFYESIMEYGMFNIITEIKVGKQSKFRGSMV